MNLKVAKPRLKVALVIRLLANRSGGAERLYCELANFLSDEGFDVTCLSYDERSGKPFYPLKSAVRHVNLASKTADISVSTITKAKRKIFTKLTKSPIGWVFNKFAWKMVSGGFTSQLERYFEMERPDVAISFMPPANTPTLLAAAKTGTKAIPTNHNVPSQDYDNPARWDPNPYDRRLRRHALKHASAIHVLFPQFGSWFGPELASKIVAIPNYVSREILKARPKSARSNVILAVGRIAEVKNYLALVQAWRLISDQHPEWTVRVYGVGPQTRLIQAEVQRLGLTSSFQLRGHQTDMADVYSDASIFCHPAHFEGFGLSVAEALALEMPVVAFADCDGVKEFVVDGSNGLMVPRQDGAAGLARALSRLITDEELRKRLGSAGPESISEFTEQAYQERWLALLDKVHRQ